MSSIKKSKIFSYPVSNAGSNPWRMPLHKNVYNAIKSVVPRNYQKQRNLDIEIALLDGGDATPLRPDDMPAIFLVHDDLKMMRSFLSHYRKMGVTRFICVDDQSTDGTAEYLLGQDDVDLYQSNVRYGEAHRGKAWREMLADKYGKNRWYLNLDSDEYLFTGVEDTLSIFEYAKRLESKGILRLPAPMIDMVPAGNLQKAIFTGTDDTMPWEVATHFDRDGYHGKLLSSGLGLRGGARVRLFGANADLMKYPLIYWDDKTSMGASIHAPKPSFRNFAPVCGCMLHFKIFSDIGDVTQKAITDKQYFEGAIEYERMGKFFNENDGTNLTSENSIEFKSADQLRKLGFILPLKINQKAG